MLAPRDRRLEADLVLEEVPILVVCELFGRRRGPFSSTTTAKPATDSSLASTPPAAPEPTITKSTTADGGYFTLYDWGIA